MACTEFLFCCAVTCAPYKVVLCAIQRSEITVDLCALAISLIQEMMRVTESNHHQLQAAVNVILGFFILTVLATSKHLPDNEVYNNLIMRIVHNLIPFLITCNI